MAKPKLALIPAAQGSKLYSVLPSSGVGDFDFTRSGSATRINSQGLIETVASGVSRLNYPMIDGVVKGCPHHILEPQRTNEWFYSEDFSNSNWIKTNVTISENSIISPDGTLSASKITDNSTSGEHRIRGNTLYIPSGANFSIFAKAAEYSFFAIANLSDGYTINFDLHNGTIVSVGSGWSDAKIENYGNGWYRLSGSVSINKTCGYGLLNDDGDFIFSGTGNKGVYIWGAQFESNSSYPTSYIKSNSGSATTRSAETATGSGSADTFNSEQGVLMAEISSFVGTDDFRLLTLNSGNIDNIILLGVRNDGNVYCAITDGGINQFTYISDYAPINMLSKLVVKYKTNDVSFWINGFKLATDTLATIPTGLNQIDFNYGNSLYPFYGNIKQVQYFDTALTDSELEQISSWTSFQEMAEGQFYSVE